MCEQTKKTAGQELDELEQKATPVFIEASSRYIDKCIGNDDEMLVRSLSPVLSFFAIRRQEKLLAKIENQSKEMTQHTLVMKRYTRALIVLTVAILVGTIIQISFLILSM